MKIDQFKHLLAATILILSGNSTLAAQLHVRPVLVDIAAPGTSSILTLQNNGAENVNAQVRIFRWTQTNGTDQLVPTRDVVASPPFVKMKPGGSYNLRVIRVSKRPVKGEESYRLIVDQIPNIGVKTRGVAVKFNVRYSIPVFFSAAKVTSPEVSWAYRAKSSRYTLSARNSGGSRIRISNLKIKNSNGSTLIISPGLAGYVLAGSSKTWEKRGKLKRAHKGVRVFAKGNNEQISASARVH